jgi:PAS domain S-box-containing protein
MRTVLLVEHEKKVQDQVKRILRDQEIKVKNVSTLSGIKRCLVKDDPILVVFNPTIKDGKSLIGFFRSQELSIPVIVLADQSELNLVMENPIGFCGVLQKPVMEEALLLAAKNATTFKLLHEEKETLINELKKYKENLETDMLEKNESLDESLLNYYTVVEQTQEGVVIVQEGKIVFTNSRFARIIHYKLDDVLNKDISIFFPPEIEEQIRMAEKEGALKKETEYFESNILTKEGKIIPIDVNVQETTFNKKPSTIIFLEDITERKKLQTQLIHTSNLAAIGQIAIGLAHDINTPLANISLLSENIYSRTEDEFIQNKLDTMDKQVDIITSIIKNLLSVYRRSREMYSDLNINEVILDTLNITKDLMFHDLEIELQFDDDLPFVMGNPEQLGQVFLNLILNSDDSIKQSGLLVIKTRFDDQFIYIDFIDNGCGIPEDKIYSIFDPFYTTKKPNKGVGLGLSICQGIIHSHNGKIEVRSEVGEGTTFTVILRR